MPQSLLLTYTLHPPSTPYLKDALTGIQAQLPLRNLHWKSSSRTSLRTIQEVDVKLVDLGEVPPNRDVAGSVLETPLVNLILIACEDAEVYKNSTKSFIRDWLSLLTARRNVHAPLIVLINPPTAENKGGKNVFGRDKGVLGKLKTDYNTGKRDRCAAVNLPGGGGSVTDPAAWPDVISKLKESVIVAFDGAISEREDEVKRGEAQRMNVGWNFCTWFLLKESLAQSFEGVNLYEDALIVYEELEATFFQVLKEHNLSWFGKLGASQPNDDSLPILDISLKSYRQMLQGSAISIFDFRVYVFARQAILLGKLGRITEVAKRGQWFVASLTRRLRENEADLAEYFIESWTYTACMDIVAKCDEWSRIDRPNGDYSGLVAYESARAELLDIARIQVERIGVAVGHLPNIYPFAPPTPLISHTEDVLFESSDAGMSEDGEEASAPVEGRPQISNQQLKETMSDITKFRTLYLGLTKKTYAAYEACGKINSMIRLKADMAALALIAEDWSNAYDICKDMAKSCAEQSIWTPVAQFALKGALESHDYLKLERDGEWTDLALAYVRVCALADAREASESSSDLEVLNRALDSLRTVSTNNTIGHRAFDLRLVGDDAGISDTGSATIEIEVINKLPMAVNVDTIKIEMTEDAIGTIEYIANDVNLAPGSNHLTLQSKTSVQGVFTLSYSAVQLGRTTFGYTFSDSVTLRVRRNTSQLQASLKMPNHISLENEPTIVFHLHTTSTDIKRGRISLLALGSEVIFHLDRAVCETAELIVDAGGISLGGVTEGEKLAVAIPYSSVSQADTVHARINLSYTTEAGDSREYIDIQSLFLGLPLTVNVQDFFRPECLLSHFTIAADGTEYLRVQSVSLKADSSLPYEIEQATNGERERLVLPNQSLSCLFKLKQSKAKKGILRLSIKYRNLDDEIRSLLEQAISDISSRQQRLRKLMQSRDWWMPAYIATGRIHSPEIPDDLLQTDVPADLPWRILEIPVEIPIRRILATVRIDRSATTTPVYEGRSIPVTLRITTDMSWVGENSGGSEPLVRRMVFDIQASPEDWIVSGRKKGFFNASEGSTESTQITLVPMRAGNLPLPTVHVQLLDTMIRSEQADETQSQLICETYVENAAETVRVLPAKREVNALVPIRREWDIIEEGVARG